MIIIWRSYDLNLPTNVIEFEESFFLDLRKPKVLSFLKEPEPVAKSRTEVKDFNVLLH